MAVFVAVALFAASALVIVMVMSGPSASDLRLLELGGLPADDAEVPFRYRLGDLLALLSAPLAPLRSLLRSNDEELEYRLSSAGYRRPEDAETYLSAKLLAPVFGVVLATFAGPQNLLIFGLGMGAAGYFAPDLFLFYAINRRKTKFGQGLPDIVDLLVICIEAGLGLDQAVLRVAEEMAPVCPPLSEEFLMISREQRAGKPRLEAWRAMANRVDLDVVRQLVAMLVQTEKLGTPIARALSTFAETLRTKRMLTAEENAAKTTVKLIFPLVLCIFPALFVVLLGPAVITLMQGLDQSAK